MLLSDKTITQLSMTSNRPLLTPFHASSISLLRVEDTEGTALRKVCSYGVSSYGYDLSLGKKFKILRGANEFDKPMVIDLNNFNQDLFRDVEVKDGDVFVLPPRGCALAVSAERICMPSDVTGVAMQKSTIARSFMEVTVTPLEAGWEGYLTLEFHNKTDFPIVMLPGMGIVQLLFFKGDQQCETTYAQRGGKYQDQGAEPVAPRLKTITAEESIKDILLNTQMTEECWEGQDLLSRAMNAEILTKLSAFEYQDIRTTVVNLFTAKRPAEVQSALLFGGYRRTSHAVGNMVAYAIETNSGYPTMTTYPGILDCISDVIQQYKNKGSLDGVSRTTFQGVIQALRVLHVDNYIACDLESDHAEYTRDLSDALHHAYSCDRTRIYFYTDLVKGLTPFTSAQINTCVNDILDAAGHGKLFDAFKKLRIDWMFDNGMDIDDMPLSFNVNNGGVQCTYYTFRTMLGKLNNRKDNDGNDEQSAVALLDVLKLVTRD